MQFLAQNPVAAAALGAAAVGGVIYGIRVVFSGGVNRVVADLSGRYVLVTGGNTGIGLETARELAKMGANVVIACRSRERMAEAAEKIRAEAKGEIHELVLDLNSLADTHRAAAEYGRRFPRLDILINNAGIMHNFADGRGETRDGFEAHVGVNHIAHAALTEDLLPLLRKSPAGRVVCVASEAHLMAPPDTLEDLFSLRSYSNIGSYGKSKLANILYARGLNNRLKREGASVRAVSLHPGVVATELFRDTPTWLKIVAGPIAPLFLKTPLQGAQTSIHTAVVPDLRDGEYYSDCAVRDVRHPTWNDSDADRLYAMTLEILRSGRAPAAHEASKHE